MTDTPENIASLTDAALEDLRKSLLTNIERIQDQLGSPNRIDPVTGVRLDGRAYFQWRQGATFAKTRKVQEYRAVKQEIRRRQDERRPRLDLSDGALQRVDPIDLLCRLRGIVVRLGEAASWRVTADDYAVLDLVTAVLTCRVCGQLRHRSGPCACGFDEASAPSDL